MTATVHQLSSRRPGCTRPAPPRRVEERPLPAPRPAAAVSSLDEARVRRAFDDLVARGVRERKARAVLAAVKRAGDGMQRFAIAARVLPASAAAAWIREHCL